MQCQQQSRRQGAAAVEFAVVLPVILFILAAAIEVGSAVHVLSAMQNAAREGARHSVIPRATSSSVIEVCAASLAGNQIKGAKISVTPDPRSAKSGSFIQVTVSAGAAENSWISVSKLMGSKLLTSTVSMRKE